METAGAPVAEAIRIRAALEPLLLETPSARIAGQRRRPARIPRRDGTRGRRRRSVVFARHSGRLHHYLASLTPNPMLRSLCANLFDLIEAAHSETPSTGDLAET